VKTRCLDFELVGNQPQQHESGKSNVEITDTDAEAKSAAETLQQLSLQEAEQATAACLNVKPLGGS
jgi:hypothetical protein